MTIRRPGINHIEFWVSDLGRSLAFYAQLFGAIGWVQLSERAFGSGSTEIYFVEKPAVRAESLGPRHLCFQAASREVVDAVGDLIKRSRADVIRGPIDVPQYSEGYYTVDFRDPDGFVLEVAYTPNMKL